MSPLKALAESAPSPLPALGAPAVSWLAAELRMLPLSQRGLFLFVPPNLPLFSLSRHQALDTVNPGGSPLEIFHYICTDLLFQTRSPSEVLGGREC